MSINQIARTALLAALFLVVVHTNPEAEAMVAQGSRALLASPGPMATNAKIGELRCRIYFGCTPTAYDMSRTDQRGDR
jgi:D-serine deaminase-like pyridoxal phosphate-dependent protein